MSPKFKHQMLRSPLKIAGLLLLCLSSLLSLHAAQELDLSGQWKFSIYPKHADDPSWRQPGYDRSRWADMTVPGSWDTENKYAHFTGTAFYVKEFDLPETWEEPSFRLRFGAVYQTTEVWLNDEYLGKHVGGYTPFEFDVTKVIRKGETNTLAVTVNNKYNRGAWWKWGGIHQKVYLVNEGPVRIVRQKIIAEPNLDDGSSTIDLEVTVRNSGEDVFTGELQSRIVSWKSQTPHGSLSKESLSVDPGETVKVSLHFELAASEARLWDLEDPYLYQLLSRLIDDHGSVSEKKDRFGIRKIETANAKLLLNGKELHLNGFNRIATHRAYGQTDPEPLIRFDIDTMMAMGARMSRIAHHAQNPALLDYCDEVGMLIIEEIPVWGKTEQQTQPNNPLTKQWLTEMIERDYNHPCVIGWSVGNELAEKNLDGQKMSWRIYEYVRTMIEHVASLDSTRLKTYVSNTATAANGPGIDPNDLVDIMMHNSYGGAPGQVQKLHQVWPEKPVFVSELGKSQIGESLDNGLHEQLKEEILALKEFDYVVGCSIWSYNDYRSHFGGTPLTENRAWGMYNVWRQPKAAAYEMRELFTAEASDAPLPTMTAIPAERPEDAVYIQAVVPMQNSCMVGFTVVDENDDYEIAYEKDGGEAQTLVIKKLRGAAKISGLEPGDYTFRIRPVRAGEPGPWSASYSTHIRH
ncbi:glycoside hydrolase family 2 TIM barrel-domain containing protein [Coraliomargarita parva]|uniref:glycoside hydrolase family 2 TIM barrel-domain containing protein n=1 Tax=Coraliomargarita parva TaxID=3014050 RepID=UPI0022B44C19|nr:glycoside hydrolase family 2 TIM barrel-domain containing protein [Coraliomargarita parva]